MRSLKHELSLIIKDSDAWYDLTASRGRKRRRVSRNGNAKPNYVDSYCGKELAIIKPEEDEDYEYKVYLEYMNRTTDCGLDGNGNGYGNGGAEDDDEVDPEYKVFLDNLRKVGNGYALEMMKKDGTKIIVKYEEGDDDFSDGGRRGGGSMLEESAKLEVSDHDDFIRIESGQMDARPFLSDCKPGMLSKVDESYFAFLSNVQIKEGSLVYEAQDCTIQYGKDDEMTADSERVADANNKVNDSNMDEDEDDQDSVQSLTNIVVASEFLDKLSCELQKPYDHKEFDDLWKEAEMRRKKERTRELRSGSVSFPTNMKSPSYLERHPDLARMVKEALLHKNRHRALFLLRGFFFYLERSCQEGAFVPWKNPSVLKMMSGI